MKEIPLSQGKVALVDDDDYGFVNSFKWYAKKSRTGNWYAVRNEKMNLKSTRGMCRKARKKRKRKQIRMHNVIMRPLEGYVVHHIKHDDDRLDNTRENLEVCTVQENSQYAADKRDGPKQQDYKLPKKPDDDIPF